MRVTRTELLTRIGLVIGITILINILAANYYLRLDFTADQRYTLSSATEQILQQTERPVTVKAYFSKNIPARLKQVKRYFRDLMVEYANASEADFVYNFINPNKSREQEQKAQQKGIKPMLVGSRERDQVTRQRVYMGAEIKIGDQTEVISQIRPQGPLEYKLSSGIRKLSNTEKPQIALLQGHDEVSKQDLGQALRKLKVLYQVESYTLKGNEPIPDQYRTAMLIHPKDSLTNAELSQLDAFLADGRGLFVATDRVESKLQQQQLMSQSTALEDWLEGKGFTIPNESLIDAECGAITVRQQVQGRPIRRRINFPYFPIVKQFEEHPITTGLGQLFLPFTSPLELTDTAGNPSYKVLATSSGTSGTQGLPARIQVSKQWTEQDFPQPKIPIAASVEGQLGSNPTAPARMVVVSSGNLIPDAEENTQGRRQGNNVREGNADFLANSIDWLSDQMGLMALRTQGVENRPVKEVSDGTRATIKYGNALAPVLVIILIGLFRYQRQQAKRKRWMQA